MPEDWNRKPNNNCKVCGTSIYIRPHRLKQGEKMGWTCSRQCSAKLRAEYCQKEQNPKWRGGTYSDSGYKMIHKPEHPNASSNGYIYIHHLIMEEKIGRFINKTDISKDKEVVHHIDGNKNNNDITNLSLMTVGNHNKLHRQLFKRIMPKLLQKGYVIWDETIQEYKVI